MTRAPDEVAFKGHWVQRGMIRVPVIPQDVFDTFDLFDFDPPPKVTPLDHVPSHSSYNLHRKRDEEPCEECKTADRIYHHNRRKTMLNDILAVLPYAGFAVACGSILMGLAIWAANAAEEHDDWML